MTTMRRVVADSRFWFLECSRRHHFPDVPHPLSPPLHLGRQHHNGLPYPRLGPPPNPQRAYGQGQLRRRPSFGKSGPERGEGPDPEDVGSDERTGGEFVGARVGGRVGQVFEVGWDLCDPRLGGDRDLYHRQSRAALLIDTKNENDRACKTTDRSGFSPGFRFCFVIFVGHEKSSHPHSPQT